MGIRTLRRRGPRSWAITTLALTAVGTVALAGCSSSGGGGGGSAAASPAANPSGTVQMLVSSAAASDAAFKAVNAAFQAKYPNVKIVFQSVPNANFDADKSSRLTAHNLDVTLAQPQQVPSYVTGGSEGDDARAADAGVYTDLTNMAFMKNFTPTVLDAIAYNGKQYTVPTGLNYYTGVFYNKSIFSKYDLQVPTTWSQFVTLCQTLQAKGVAPLGIGGKDSWPAGLTMLAAVQSLYPTTADKNTLAQDLWSQKVKLTDSTPQEVLTRVSQMYGFAQKNFAGVAYATIPSEFAAGDFAMTPDGTWDQVTIDQAVGSKFQYGYFPIPVSDNAADNATLGGKVDLRLAVPSNAPNKGAALAYLAFFSDPTNYALYVKTSGIIPAQPNIAATPFLQSIAPYTKTFAPAWDTIWVANNKSGQAATFPFNYPAIAPMGTMSAQQAAQAAQSAWSAGF